MGVFGPVCTAHSGLIFFFTMCQTAVLVSAVFTLENHEGSLLVMSHIMNKKTHTFEMAGHMWHCTEDFFLKRLPPCEIVRMK